MKKIISSIFLLLLVTGCSLNNGVDEKKAAVSIGKSTFNSLSELKSAKEKESDPILKVKSKLYMIEEKQNGIKVNKIEIGQEVANVYYTSTKSNSGFTIQQQKFADINGAYKDSVSRMEKANETETDGKLVAVARPGEAVLVTTVMDDYLISLVLPEGTSDEEIAGILKSIYVESI